MDTSIRFEDVQNNIRILKPLENMPDLPGKQWAIKVNSLSVAPGGLRTDLPNVSPVLFQDINYISIFEIVEHAVNSKYFDLYVARQQHPYRV